MKRSGTADLPLHNGRVPPWLSERMARMGLAVTEAILMEFGKSEYLSRLSDPFWFQALGCVMGMDWHSSGITTSVMGALKRALNPLHRQLGVYVCGGRGRYSRREPRMSWRRYQRSTGSKAMNWCGRPNSARRWITAAFRTVSACTCIVSSLQMKGSGLSSSRG